MSLRFFTAACVSGAAVALACASPRVAPAPRTSAFVTTLGRDTVAFEQYTRAGNTITGDHITRQGGTVVNHYAIVLGANGAVTAVEITPRRGNGSPIPGQAKSITMTASGDSATIVVMRDTAVTRRIVTNGAFPLLGNSMAFYEVAMAAKRALKQDSIPLQGLVLAQARLGAPLQLKFFGADSARVWNSVYPQYFKVDANGMIAGMSGRATTVKVETRKVASLDLPKLVAAFVATDAARNGLAAATSARDTVNATVGLAKIWVDYGRPFTRGRNVFSNGVLGDTLWRTGANAATQFKTDVDLVINGKTIPAGIYTLWTTVPRDNSRYALLFNSQVGQWGTVHDAARDVVSVPLTVAKLAELAEEFTIVVEPTATGGVLALHWGGTRLFTPFTVK